MIKQATVEDYSDLEFRGTKTIGDAGQTSKTSSLVLNTNERFNFNPNSSLAKPTTIQELNIMSTNSQETDGDEPFKMPPKVLPSIRVGQTPIPTNDVKTKSLVSNQTITPSRSTPKLEGLIGKAYKLQQHRVRYHINKDLDSVRKSSKHLQSTQPYETPRKQQAHQRPSGTQDSFHSRHSSLRKSIKCPDGRTLIKSDEFDTDRDQEMTNQTQTQLHISLTSLNQLHQQNTFSIYCDGDEEAQPVRKE